METGLKLTAGDVIKVHYSTFTHYGIVSDRIGFDGMPMIIDHSSAAKTVAERPWTEATQGKRVSRSDLVSNRTPRQTLTTAKQLVGKLEYSLTGLNCEAFVKHALGLPPTSKQVAASLVTVPSAAYLAHKASEGNLIVTGMACLLALAITNHTVAK